MALLERIVSSPANVYVANTREEALAAAISGSGTAAVEFPRTPTWQKLERFTNDNVSFLQFNPAPQNPTYVWTDTTYSGQSLGLAAVSSSHAFQQATHFTVNMAVFADNALQVQVDLVNAGTGEIISAAPLGVLLQEGSMDPITGIAVEKKQFPYNWQNIRVYTIETDSLPAGSYRIAISCRVVNYDQFNGLPNPAALSFFADISAN